MKNKKAFTLLELVAVLVILAILALIVTPIVMNIISKAKDSANKRSIDAYGRSIELAIASHLLDTGKFPTNIGELKIEYNGDEVVCETQEINPDSTVYLAGCTVGGRRVEGYTYGKGGNVTYDAYEVGDEVTYNNVDYYVIKDSSESEEDVTLLKAEPIKSSEISSYLSSTEIANKVSTGSTYAIMAYYSSENCVSGGAVSEGCSTDYSASDIKQLVDVWKTNYANDASEARLITLDDLKDNLGIELNRANPSTYENIVTNDTPEWVILDNITYWTMTANDDEIGKVWTVSGNIMPVCISAVIVPNSGNYTVRPVITIKKSVLN